MITKNCWFRKTVALLSILYGVCAFSISQSMASGNAGVKSETDKVVRGVVKQVSLADQHSTDAGLQGSFLIEERGRQFGMQQIVVHVSRKTEIFVGDSQSSVLMQQADLHDGEQVEVTISGDQMMLSHPVQVKAVKINIIRD